MSLIDQLYEEHQRVTEAVFRLEENLAKVEGASGSDEISPYIQALQGIAAELNGELGPHLELEEQRLFPAMERHLGREGGPLAVMLMEHETMRNSLKRFSEAVDGLSGALDPEQMQELIHAGSAIGAILSEHIHKEDFILFPMARNFLTQEEIEQLING